MPRLECLNIGFAPCPIAIALDLGTPNAARWIISAHALCDAVLHHCAEGLQKLIGCLRRADFGGEYGLNVIRPQWRYALVAVLLPKALENILSGAPRFVRKISERPRVEITHNRGSDSAGLGATSTNLDARGILHCGLIGCHEGWVHGKPGRGTDLWPERRR